MPKGLQEITGAVEARRALRKQIAHGTDWIKILTDSGYIKLPSGEYRSIPNLPKKDIEAIADETIKI